MFRIKSDLMEIRLAQLKPTQITVGFREVEKKRAAWKKMKRADREDAMRLQLFPVVKGRSGVHYILDHHHTARAMLEEGCGKVLAGLVEDLSAIDDEALWVFLDHHSWVHAYDENGHRRPFDAIPGRLEDMRDDDFRSFAGEVRDAGGFAKPTEPFMEFLWANFFRDCISAKKLRKDREKALAEALNLAASDAARHLPGWSGSK